MASKDNRDDFPAKVRDRIAKMSAYRCSNPACRRMTIGSSQDHSKEAFWGVVSHICAAAPGGPRYDPSMSPEERAGEENGLLLCRYCAALVDADEEAYPPQLLRMWRDAAYRQAAETLTAPADGAADSQCWSVVRRLVRACLCTYQTQGKVSDEANFRSSAGVLYRLLFEALPRAADIDEQLELWSRTVGMVYSDVLEPARCRTSHYDRSFPRRYRILMEEWDTYSVSPQARRAQILNHMEEEIRVLFQTGECLLPERVPAGG